MKYEAEIIREILEQRGHEKSSLHYQTECIETWIEEAKGGYPKLCDYESEWLNYIIGKHIGEFPYVTLTDVTEASVDNVIPYAYKRAILKGQTLVNVNRSNYTANTNITTDYGQAIEFYDADMLPNTTYTIIMYSDNPYECRFSQMHNDREYALGVVKVGTPFVFTTEGNHQGLRSYLKGDELNIPQGTEIKILIIEGDYTNIDIPYFEGMQSVKMPVLTTSNEDGTKTNILTVNEDVTLRGIGDVHDTLDCLTGELTQNIHETTLNGQKDTSIINNNSLGYINYQGYLSKVVTGKNNEELYLQLVHGEFANSSDFLLKDGFLQFKGYRSSDAESEEGLYRYAGTDHAYLYIKTSRFTNHSLAGVKQFLSENPQTYYVLNKPKSIKTVDLSVVDENGNEVNHFIPIEGTMHIQTDGTPIKPTVTLEIPVEAITQNLTSFIEMEE